MPAFNERHVDGTMQPFSAQRQRGLSADDYFDKAQQTAAFQAVERVLHEHVTQIMEIRETFEVDDLDLLSINISKHAESNQRLRKKSLVSM